MKEGILLCGHGTRREAGVKSFKRLVSVLKERYQDAYRTQLDSFITSLITKTPTSPSFTDGMKAQQMADAAQESLVSGKPVKLS